MTLETIEVNGKKYEKIKTKHLTKGSGVYFEGCWYEPVEEKPLFITKDGFKLYDRKEEVYAVNTDTFEFFYQHAGSSIGTWLNGWYGFNGDNNPPKYDWRVKFKLFKDLENAKEYILLNKPLLSLNEILKVWTGKNNDNLEGSKIYATAPLFLNFKEAAKGKLK